MLKILFISLSLLSSCQNKDENTFSFASSGEFRPFSFTDDNGELKGYDIEVGIELAKRMNKAPKPVKYKFTGIVEGVKTGRFDAGVASQTITEERKKHVAFTIPYYYSGPQVFSREKKAPNIERDLTKKNIAVSKGSTYIQNANVFTEDLSIYDSDITALEALQNGRHDYVITDAITGAMAMKRGLKIYGHQVLGESRQGISVSLENKDLLQRINKFLKVMIEDGTLKDLGIKYFNKDISRPSNSISK